MRDEKATPVGQPHSLLMAALVFVGAIWLGFGSLQSSRPSTAGYRPSNLPLSQDVPARLWQDPLEAINKALADRRQDRPVQLEQLHRLPYLGEQIAQSVKETLNGADPKGDAPLVVVLAVMLPGGPHAELAEVRRRTRYAVLSGLNAGNFEPYDNAHLGFVVLDNERAGKQAGAASSPPLPPVIAYERFVQGLSGRPRADRGSSEIGRLEPRPDVFVLWLDADLMERGNPLAALLQLREDLTQKVTEELAQDRMQNLRQKQTQKQKQKQTRDLSSRVGWRVLGPYTSEGLRNLAREDHPEWMRPQGKGEPPRVRMYSSWATLPDDRVSDGASPKEKDKVKDKEQDKEKDKSWRNRLESQGVFFRRVVADDRQLAGAMIDELARRGLKADVPKDFNVDNCTRRSTGQPGSLPSHVAIVGEWDTLYGRMLAHEFSASADKGTGRTRGPKGFCVLRFNFMRGLDGLMPGVAAAASAPELPGQRDPARAALDALRRDGAYVERPEGQGQFDYLRRIAERILAEDERLRSEQGEGGGIRAVGVLAKDAYDKLLVLQALQPMLPRAIFFTTDLDTRLLHPRELPWTRNLLVASSYGLRLDERWQRAIPPFRDTSQTAAFLATQLALEDARFDFKKLTGPGHDIHWEDKHPDRLAQHVIDKWLDKSRIFEVSRRGAFDFSPAPGGGAAAGPKAGCWKVSLLVQCANVHPDERHRIAPMPDFSARWLMLFAALLLLLAPPLALAMRPRQWLEWRPAFGRATYLPAWRQARWAALFLACGLAALLLAFRWGPIAGFLTEGGGGKPLNLTEGISPWPAHAIRLYAFALCIYLLWAGLLMLGHNLDGTAWHLHLHPNHRRLERELCSSQCRWRWRHRIQAIFGVRALIPSKKQLPSLSELPARADAFWAHYLVRNTAFSRLLRSALATAVMAALGWALVRTLGGDGPFPQRGTLSAIPDRLDAVAWVALQFLVVFVLDATLLCTFFMRALRAQPRLWLASVTSRFACELNAQPRHLDEWIDLQVIVKRTHCVMRLIYFPFFVLSLLLLARSSMFDDRPLAPGIVLLALLNVAMLVLAAWRLRRTAEDSRTHAMNSMQSTISRMTGGDEAQRLQQLLERIRALQGGALVPFWQQPLLKAVSLPLVAVGSISLVDYLALLNL